MRIFIVLLISLGFLIFLGNKIPGPPKEFIGLKYGGIFCK